MMERGDGAFDFNVNVSPPLSDETEFWVYLATVEERE
jgi:hypothetical protein